MLANNYAISRDCFHCALPMPAGCELSVAIEDEQHPVCCPGCKAVAELIRDSGMSNYYALRDTPQPGIGRPPDDETEWAAFNSDAMQQAFADVAGTVAEATVYAGGMYCSACSWLIDSTLNGMEGVRSADVNPMTHRVQVTWDTQTVGLGDVLARLAALGYQPQPLAPDDVAKPEVAEQRAALKRLLVASLGMMQVMMFAVGLYAGEFQGIDDDMQRFLRLVSFFVTTPVVLYAAQPFFKSAWRGVAAGMPGMDLPVSIAIGAAYVASVYSTFTNGAAVWFDSVTMFVFFLTLGRFLEMRARHRSIDRSVALSQLIPNTATRIDDGALFTVPVSQLAAGDTICIRPGDSVPADGRIIDGATSVDESLLTGESEPQPCIVGDLLAAGSVNIDGAVYMLVTQTGNDTALGSIARMSRRARYARPSFVQTADRVASYIVIALLLVAAAVATYWSFVDPERAFVITLSVLVVTCPCALALATPAAFATAGARMAQLHLLVTDGNAIESLSRATHLVFDKTGTLTTGRPQLQATHIVAPDFTASECLQYAAVLEAISSHPISHAFPPQEELPTVDDARVVIGQGVSGRIAGHEWRIGNAAFTGVTNAPVSTGTTVFLARDNDVIARFDITDELRSDANDVLATLRRLGFGITLASGDNEHAVSRVAKQLSIDNVQANCAPAEKLALIRRLQDQGEHVVMIGDGINDAPVLAGADASISFAHGALLAQTSADVIALGESLQPVVTAHRISKRTMQIVRQNLAWAIAYNLVALPLAAAGYVPPWAAAIGMSASSLIVVLNALRLNRYT